MSSELYISSTPKGDRIALLQDKRLTEYHLEENSNNFHVGDIYLGLVKKVQPGLNAAFVDIGYEKDAFLHYLDLGSYIKSLAKFLKLVQNNKNQTSRLNELVLEPEIEKLGKINQVLTKNQHVLVQVAKEPISNKGPRLSCEISLAGRYIVLVPFTNTVSISKKITSKEERQRLVRLIQSIRPENFGVIIRTVAIGKDVAELDKDLRGLVQRWDDGVSLLHTAKPQQLIIGEVGRASSMLRDLLSDSFDSITTDSKEMYEEIRSYVRNIAPDKEKIVRLHTGKNKLFDHVGVEKQLKTLFGKSVSLPNGGYLIVEHTEALHVIDVNSGSSSNKSESEDQESTALNANMEAAKEIARQLRLRDMGGIIVVDFIDMKKPENKKAIFEYMCAEMKIDRARHTVLPLSKFGIMQITRQRVRPETNVVTLETCPVCNGTGKIASSFLIADHIQESLDFVLAKQNESGVSLVLNPFLAAYFTKGILSKQVSWFFKYYKWVKIVSDTSMAIVEFKIRNKENQDIELGV